MSLVYSRESWRRSCGDLALSVWDVEPLACWDSVSEDGLKPDCARLSEGSIRSLKDRVGISGAVGSEGRQRPSYLRLVPDILGWRVRLFLEGEVTGLALWDDMMEFGVHEVAPFALPVPPGSTFEGMRSGCVALTAGAEQGGKTSSASLRTSTSRVWDEIGLRVWDVEIFECIDSRVNGAEKPVTEERCRAVFQILQRRLDMLKPDGSRWRQRASYVRVSQIVLRGRSHLLFSAETSGGSRCARGGSLRIAYCAWPLRIVCCCASGRCNRRRPPS